MAVGYNTKTYIIIDPKKFPDHVLRVGIDQCKGLSGVWHNIHLTCGMIKDFPLLEFRCLMENYPVPAPACPFGFKWTVAGGPEFRIPVEGDWFIRYNSVTKTYGEVVRCKGNYRVPQGTEARRFIVRPLVGKPSPTIQNEHPVEVSIGDGYRKLNPQKDKLQKGDEYYNKIHGMWIKSYTGEFDKDLIYRRAISVATNKPPLAPRLLKYWVVEPLHNVVRYLVYAGIIYTYYHPTEVKQLLRDCLPTIQVESPKCD